MLRKSLKEQRRVRVLSRLVRICYKERNQNLKILGYVSYRDYLKSSLWQSIRERVFAISKRCFVCGESGKEVHHFGYGLEVLKGKDIAKLKCICRNCHQNAEFRTTGDKLPVDLVNVKMLGNTAQLRPCLRCGKPNAAGFCKACRHTEKYGLCSVCCEKPPIKRYRKKVLKYCYACAKDTGLKV